MFFELKRSSRKSLYKFNLTRNPNLEDRQQQYTKNDPVDTERHESETLQEGQKELDRRIGHDKTYDKTYDKGTPVCIGKILVVLEQVVSADRRHDRDRQKEGEFRRGFSVHPCQQSADDRRPRTARAGD